MPAEDLFKRYLEVGASVLGMSRERAEGIVRDLVASGEVAKGQATKAADWLVERGRTGTEELAEMIRREIRQQVAAMGLATRDDLARIEARLDDVGVAATPRAPAEPAAAAQPEAAASRKASAPRVAAATRKPAAAKRPTGTDRSGAPEGAQPAPARKPRAAAAPRPSSGRGQAGITRSGSVKRSGPAGGGSAGGAPPARKPARPKG